jgi:ring-1,2-phenylacetyl-CoA epoxidase subunit PaaC
MSQTGTAATGVDAAEQLAPEVRGALRGLILTLADNKRLLGIRYSDWMLGAPTLETGIAASSMAQDEWGHSRLTYALLSDFGDDPKRLEHEREASGYHSLEVLDSPLGSWAELIAAVLLLDTALSVQYDALVESRYAPVHNRVQKLLDEEEYHFQYAAGWAQRLAGSEGVRTEFVSECRRLLPVALRWLGRSDAEALQPLLRDEIVRADPDTLRERFAQRVGPVLAAAGMAADLGLRQDGGPWRFAGELDWEGWDDARRRSGAGGPDAETLARVRGDKNRAMLLE